jgi:uncharacterized membrane protein YhhN
MHVSAISLTLLVASVAASGLYGFVFLHRPTSYLRALVKTGAIAALAAAVAQSGVGPAIVLLLAALAASALGDFLLALEGTWALALGILAFLIAQLAYVIIFFGLWILGGDLAPLEPRYATSVCVIGAMLAFLAWLWGESETPGGKPHAYAAMFAALVLGFAPVGCLPVLFALSQGTIGNLSWIFWMLILAFCAVLIVVVVIRRDVGALRIGVMPYAATIGVMAYLAMWAPWQAWPAMVGAALFLISDGVLAVELFKLPADAPARRITAPLVWWTYYCAQVLIALGVILAARALT